VLNQKKRRPVPWGAPMGPLRIHKRTQGEARPPNPNEPSPVSGAQRRLGGCSRNAPSGTLEREREREPGKRHGARALLFGALGKVPAEPRPIDFTDRGKMRGENGKKIAVGRRASREPIEGKTDLGRRGGNATVESSPAGRGRVARTHRRALSSSAASRSQATSRQGPALDDGFFPADFDGRAAWPRRAGRPDHHEKVRGRAHPSRRVPWAPEVAFRARGFAEAFRPPGRRGGPSGAIRREDRKVGCRPRRATVKQSRPRNGTRRAEAWMPR